MREVVEVKIKAQDSIKLGFTSLFYIFSHLVSDQMSIDSVEWNHCSWGGRPVRTANLSI